MTLIGRKADLIARRKVTLGLVGFTLPKTGVPETENTSGGTKTTETKAKSKPAAKRRTAKATKA